MPDDPMLNSLLTLWPSLTPEQRVLVRDMAGSIHTANLYRSDISIVVAGYLKGCEAVVEAARAEMEWRTEIFGESEDECDCPGCNLAHALAVLDAARPVVPATEDGG